MNWFMTALKKYATFSGRSRRSEYWQFFLVYVVILVAASAVDTMLIADDGMGALTGLVAFGLLLPSLAVTVRRFHDIGKSGWWFFINLVPVVGPLLLLYFMAQDGQAQENAYGPNPKAA